MTILWLRVLRLLSKRWYTRSYLAYKKRNVPDIRGDYTKGKGNY